MDEAVQGFLSLLEALGRSRETCGRYRRTLARLVAFLGGLGRKRWADVERADLVAFAASKIPPGREDVVSVIRVFCRHLSREGITLGDPSAVLARRAFARASASRPPSILSTREVDRFVERVAESIRNRLRNVAIVELLYGSAIRISELLGLDLGDVDLERALVFVRLGKGGRERVVPVAAGAVRTLRVYLAEERPRLDRGRSAALFLSERSGRMGKGAIHRIFQEARGNGRRIHPHLLRHACATHLAQGGMDLRMLQEILGHVSIETTVKYLDVADRELVDEVRKRHPRSGIGRRGGAGGPLPGGPE